MLRQWHHACTPPAPTLDHRRRRSRRSSAARAPVPTTIAARPTATPGRPRSPASHARPLVSPVDCTSHAVRPLSTRVQAENAKIYMCCASHNNELPRRRREEAALGREPGYAEAAGHDSNSQVTMC